MPSRQPVFDFDRRVPLGSRAELDRLFAELERPLDSHAVASGLATFASRLSSSGLRAR